MKQMTLFIAILLFVGAAMAQVPQKFNYQGIARDAKGNAMSMQKLSLKLTILPTADATVAEYEETQMVTTNEFGLYALQIGNGTPVMGEMKTVKWETGNKYIKVVIDPSGGTNYVDAGTTQLLSVPYAIYADKAGIALEAINRGTTPTKQTRATNNFIEKTSAAGVVNSNSMLFDNGSGIALGFTTPLYTFESRRPGNTDWCIRTTNTAGTSRSAFRIQNEDSTLGQIDITKFGKNFGGSFMGISRNNMAVINSLTGPLVLNCGGDMTFGNSLTVPPFTQTPRMTINGTTGNVGFGLPLGGAAAARVEVNGQIKINGGAPGVGKVLTSDATGLATWQTPAAGGVSSVNGAAGAVTNSVTMGSSGTNTAVSGSGTNAVTIQIPTANATNTGKLSNTDWITFNNKLSGTVTTNLLPKSTGTNIMGNSQIFDNGTSVGVGTTTPNALAKLDVNGQVRISGGAPGVGKVLTSDATGLATWQTPSGGGGGVTSVNGATGAVVNSLTMGSAGTNTAVTGSGTNAVTINIPTASATNTGKLSNTDWTSFNNKANTIGGLNNFIPKYTPNGNTLGNSSLQDSSGLWYNATPSTNFMGLYKSASPISNIFSFEGNQTSGSNTALFIEDSIVGNTRGILFGNKNASSNEQGIVVHNDSINLLLIGGNSGPGMFSIDLNNGKMSNSVNVGEANFNIISELDTAAQFVSINTSGLNNIGVIAGATSDSNNSVTGLAAVASSNSLSNLGFTQGIISQVVSGQDAVGIQGLVFGFDGTIIGLDIDNEQIGDGNNFGLFANAETVGDNTLVTVGARVNAVAPETNQGTVVGLEANAEGGDNSVVGISGFAIGDFTGGNNDAIGVLGQAVGGLNPDPFFNADNAYSIYGGQASGGFVGNYAGYFSGNVAVTGTLSKSGGTFKIDHPQDPENKFLIHSFVESPDMMNVYNGNITSDANGNAIVELPTYFEAENKDFKYQLTVIDNSADFVMVKVTKEVNNNTFSIKTSKPNVKVSWQVTGVRQDAWANANRVVAEVDKKDRERGKYLNPEVFGKDKSFALHPQPEIKREEMSEKQKVARAKQKETLKAMPERAKQASEKKKAESQNKSRLLLK